MQTHPLRRRVSPSCRSHWTRRSPGAPGSNESILCSNGGRSGESNRGIATRQQVPSVSPQRSHKRIRSVADPTYLVLPHRTRWSPGALGSHENILCSKGGRSGRSNRSIASRQQSHQSPQWRSRKHVHSVAAYPPRATPIGTAGRPAPQATTRAPWRSSQFLGGSKDKVYHYHVRTSFEKKRKEQLCSPH